MATLRDYLGNEYDRAMLFAFENRGKPGYIESEFGESIYVSPSVGFIPADLYMHWHDGMDGWGEDPPIPSPIPPQDNNGLLQEYIPFMLRKVSDERVTVIKSWFLLEYSVGASEEEIRWEIMRAK